MIRHDIDTIKAAARFRWVDLFVEVGLGRELLDGKHHPCPKCGGRNRFRLLDSEDGAAMCNQCFPKDCGDGLAVLGWFTGWKFPQVVDWLVDRLGIKPGASQSIKTASPARTRDAKPRRRDLQPVLDKSRSHLDTAKLDRLADSTGVPVTGWASLAPGWLSAPELRGLGASGPGWRENPPLSAWCFPERDGRGNLVGLGLRAEDGRKGAPSGASRGLVVPVDLASRPGVVVIPEGASDTAACCAVGVAAVGRPSNLAGADHLAELLADREVIVLGERDAKPDGSWPGLDGARAVAEKLAAKWGRPVPWALPPTGYKDVREWLVARPDLSPERLLADLERQGVPSEPARVEARPPDPYRPFPVDAVPEPIRGFLVEVAAAIGCDLAFVALPTLAVLGASIGTTRALVVKGGWIVHPILWTVVVGESGSAKSPAFRIATKPARDRERRAIERYNRERERHQAELRLYERALAEWKKSKSELPPPDPPVEPHAERCIVGDTTVQALAPLLLQNPRGLLLALDELAGWFGSFDKFTNGKDGGDAANWLSMYNAESVIVDRRTGVPPTIFVPRAAMGVCGGIQPAVYHRVLGVKHRDSGMAARLLPACPPRHVKRWSEDQVEKATEARYADVIERLHELRHDVAEDGEVRPHCIGMNREAKAVWVEFYNRHGDEQAKLVGDLAAAWSKLEETPARLALVIHYVRWSTGELTTETIDADTMRRAIELAEWFKYETRRCYAILGESSDDREVRKLIEWIRGRGGEVTTRDLQRSLSAYRPAGAAERALGELVRAGVGEWGEFASTPRGGAPTRSFRLTTDTTADRTTDRTPPGTHISRSGGGSVGIVGVAGGESQKPQSAADGVDL